MKAAGGRRVRWRLDASWSEEGAETRTPRGHRSVGRHVKLLDLSLKASVCWCFHGPRAGSVAGSDRSTARGRAQTSGPGARSVPGIGLGRRPGVAAERLEGEIRRV